MPWRRKWQLAPIFLPGKFHRQRSLVGYSLWDHKESHMTEVTEHTHAHSIINVVYYCYVRCWESIVHTRDILIVTPLITTQRPENSAKQSSLLFFQLNPWWMHTVSSLVGNERACFLCIPSMIPFISCFIFHSPPDTKFHSFKKKLFIYYSWLHWFFTAVLRLSLVVVCVGYSSYAARASHCGDASSVEHGL